MKVKVVYTEPHISEIEINETMIKELYSQFHDIDKVVGAIDDYIVKESGYEEERWANFEYLDDENDIEDYVCEVIDKIKEEEK